jgi:hypothetical protein
VQFGIQLHKPVEDCATAAMDTILIPDNASIVPAFTIQPMRPMKVNAFAKDISLGILIFRHANATTL